MEGLYGEFVGIYMVSLKLSKDLITTPTRNRYLFQVSIAKIVSFDTIWHNTDYRVLFYTIILHTRLVCLISSIYA